MTTVVSTLQQQNTLLNALNSSVTTIANSFTSSGGGGSTPTTGAITQKATGQFFTQNKAIIDRFNDRVFVGPATVNDGAYPNVTQDWLAIEIAPQNPVESAQMAVLSQNGLAGFVSASRTSDQANPTSAIGAEFFGLGDSTAAGADAYALYAEARRTVATVGVTFAAEYDVANQSNIVRNSPYGQSPGETIALQIASGAGLSLPGNTVTTAAIQFEANPTQFYYGIIFGSSSIYGTDGFSGAGVAIAFAKGHSIAWFNSSGNPTAIISCQATVASATANQIFEDNGVNFVNGSDQSQTLQILCHAGTAGYFRMEYSAGTCYLEAINGDLGLAPAAGQYVDLGGAAGPTASGGGAAFLPSQPAGYFSIKLNGSLQKIPYYN